jgi:hypothetical protein
LRDYSQSYTQKIQRKYNSSLPILIIDEISMIDAEFFDIICLLHYFRRVYSRKYDLLHQPIRQKRIQLFYDKGKDLINTPRNKETATQFFNAVPEDLRPPILISGDFGQIPPVTKDGRKEYLLKKYHSVSAFDSYARQILRPATILLTTNYRQDASKHDYDPDEARFVDVLQKIKYNQWDQGDIDFLNKKVITPEIYSTNFKFYKPLYIATVNRKVRDVNQRLIDSISGDSYVLEKSFSSRPRDDLSIAEQSSFKSWKGVYKDDWARNQWIKTVQENIKPEESESVTVKL